MLGNKEIDIENKLFGEARKLIGNLTEKGKFWGRGEALCLEKRLINAGFFANKKPIIIAEMFSAASSTYYAANGNALSHIWQANLFSKSLWFWRAWRCLRKAEKYSDEFARLKRMEDMTLGELDTRACVLNKAGRRNEALVLLRHGIVKIPTKQIGTKHDLCLFLIHEAEIYGKMKKIVEAENNYTKAIKFALPDLTKVRVLKSYGKFLAENKRIDAAESLLGDALDLAMDNNLHDQEVKIKAIFKHFKLVIR